MCFLCMKIKGRQGWALKMIFLTKERGNKEMGCLKERRIWKKKGEEGNKLSLSVCIYSMPLLLLSLSVCVIQLDTFSGSA